MKTLPLNEARYSAPIINMSSLSLSCREELGRIYSDLTGSSASNAGRNQFIIVEILAKPVRSNASKPRQRKAVNSQTKMTSQPLGKIETRELYNEYREYFENTYKQKKRETEEYGAKNYAAQKIKAKIWNERHIAVNVRNIILAMNLRIFK